MDYPGYFPKYLLAMIDGFMVFANTVMSSGS
jgi:hypothetical protein